MSIQTESPVALAVPPIVDAALSKPADLRRRVVRGGSLLIASRLLTQLFVWSVTLIVARLLLPYDYGLMATGMIFVGLADLLAEVGVGKALVQRATLDDDDLAEGFSLSLLLSLGLYGILFATAGPAAVFLQAPEFTLFLRVLALVVLLVPFKAVPLAVLERGLRLGNQSAVHVATAALQAVLVLTLAFAGCGYWALVAGALAARIAEAAALLTCAAWRPRWRLPSRRAHGLLAYGVHASLASLLWFVYSSSDYAIIGKLAGPIVLGYYALAFQLISLPVQKLTVNVNQIAFPVFCRLQHDPVRVRDWYLRLTALVGFLGTPTLAGMALVAEDGLTVVLGEKWLPAVLPFRLLSLVGVIMVVSATLPPLLNALGRPDVNVKYNGVCLLVFPAGFALFGSRYGLAGVCGVWLVCYPLVVAGLVVSTRRLTGVSVRDLLQAQTPVVAAALFMAAVVLAVQWGMNDYERTPLRLGVSIAAGAAAYGGFLWLTARHTVLADLRLLLREWKRKGPLAA